MSFKTICMEILAIAEGMEEGTVSFTYDNLSSAMKMGHPAEFLMEALDEVFDEIQNETIPAKGKAASLLKSLKRIQRSFKIKELASPIKSLTAYLEQLA